MTMQLIEHIELASSAASITFSDIPQTYTDLYLVVSARSDYSGSIVDMTLEFNGLTTNLSSRWLQGSGSAANSASSASLIDGLANAATSTASTFGNAAIYIPNYTAAQAKSVSMDLVTETNATAIYSRILAGLWNSTAAITSLKVNSYSGNFVQYSSATLFGILAGSDGTTTVA